MFQFSKPNSTFPDEVAGLDHSDLGHYVYCMYLFAVNGGKPPFKDDVTFEQLVGDGWSRGLSHGRILAELHQMEFNGETDKEVREFCAQQDSYMKAFFNAQHLTDPNLRRKR